MEDIITLSLNRKQALVLSEWLQNLDEKENTEYAHPAEERVVWHLQAQLEKLLTEPFAANYKSLLATARNDVATA